MLMCTDCNKPVSGAEAIEHERDHRRRRAEESIGKLSAADRLALLGKFCATCGWYIDARKDHAPECER